MPNTPLAVPRISHMHHGLLEGVGLVAWARRTSAAMPTPVAIATRRFHKVGGARRRSVTKLRKLSLGLSANHDPM
jgi:hypothetical protein